MGIFDFQESGCVMNQEAIDQIKAGRDELRRRADWYEELRTATDGGSESMTHEDAIEHVKALAAENEMLREAAQQALDVLKENHQWHQEYDYVDGYPESFMEKQNTEVITSLTAALTKEATNG